ncbi:MAG: type II toxin-antitoxin system Phd/YefM family antitoxin [Deltaproteobacteria bacterium]|nr:type II toxin-antitoxin system Phd/YefM family antitoxin [Deltaproteobacteria bacterium]MDD9852775.1 type II toxin-antitoxin system Phd/YefM family antitoxin [Deltaproteobacteria bacterium]
MQDQKMQDWKLQDAKSRFSELVRDAESEPQVVTRRGKRTVVVLAADAYDRLRSRSARHAPDAIEVLLNIPEGDWEPERVPLRLRDGLCEAGE